MAGRSKQVAVISQVHKAFGLGELKFSPVCSQIVAHRRLVPRDESYLRANMCLALSNRRCCSHGLRHCAVWPGTDNGTASNCTVDRRLFTTEAAIRDPAGRGPLRWLTSRLTSAAASRWRPRAGPTRAGSVGQTLWLRSTGSRLIWPRGWEEASRSSDDWQASSARRRPAGLKWPSGADRPTSGRAHVRLIGL